MRNPALFVEPRCVIGWRDLLTAQSGVQERATKANRLTGSQTNRLQERFGKQVQYEGSLPSRRGKEMKGSCALVGAATDDWV